MFAVTEKTSKTKVKLTVSDGLSNQAQPGEPGASLESFSISDGGNLVPPFRSMLEFHFPEGEGWKPITVTLTW
jgi:hypothetical protein